MAHLSEAEKFALNRLKQITMMDRELIICELGCPHDKYSTLTNELPMVFYRHLPGHNAEYVRVQNEFAIPISAMNEPLMWGVKWNTCHPRDPTLPAIKNSCMLDGLLTAFKLRTMMRFFCLECLFFYTPLPDDREIATTHKNGLKVESALRQVMNFIIINGVSTPVEYGKLTHDQDLVVKSFWVSPFCWDTSRQNPVPDFDLTRPPRNQRQALVIQFLEWKIVLKNLTPVTRYYVEIQCKCPAILGVSGNLKYRMWEKRLTCFKLRSNMNITPAFYNFNGDNYQFDLNYFDTEENEDRNTAANQRNDICQLRGMECPQCKTGVTCNRVMIPQTTWALIVEVPKKLNQTLLGNLKKDITAGGIKWEIAFVSYIRNNYHYVTVQNVDEQYFYYDDCNSNGILKRIDVVPSDPNGGIYHEMKRIYYFRTSPKEFDQHRCFKRTLLNFQDPILVD